MACQNFLLTHGDGVNSFSVLMQVIDGFPMADYAMPSTCLFPRAHVVVVFHLVRWWLLLGTFACVVEIIAYPALLINLLELAFGCMTCGMG